MRVKLALVGKDISHSQSPNLHQKIWGDELLVYDLIDISKERMLPSLRELSQKYHGINITSPYKESYYDKVDVESDVAREIGALNTISLIDMTGTNTDALAVEKIIKNYLENIPRLKIHLLGSGVMARMTVLIAEKLKVNLHQYSRKMVGDLTNFNFSKLDQNDLIINSCSREFSFKGLISSDCHFWDYNYSYDHHLYLKQRVKTYQDGRELLWEQAICAAEFWRQKTKLNN